MPRHKTTICLPAFLLAFHLAYPTYAQSGVGKPATAAISGHVLLKGEPARNVLVYLQPQGSPWPSNPDAYLRARTDDNGRFRIAGVAAGAYRVAALSPGLISSDSDRSGLGGKIFNVSEGENVEGVEIELKQGGVVTGRVTDSQGRPIADERVTLSKLDRNGRTQSEINSGSNYEMYQTDDRGVYRIYGLPEGRYLVSLGARQSGGMVSGGGGGTFYPRTFHPDATIESKAKVIEVAEGSEKTDIDITVPEAIRTLAISGRVVNAETGQPVAGVEISFGLRSDDGRYYVGGGPGVRSRANGEFHLKGLAPGKYGVFPRGDGNNDFFGEPASCDLSEGDASGVEVKVRLGGSISGFVVIEGAKDPMALAKLPQLYLSASVRPDQSRTPRMDNPKINPDGSFSIRGLPPCNVNIQFYPRIEHRGLALARIERNGAPAPDGIKVSAGEYVTGVRVVLTYATVTLRGEVKITGATLPAGQKLYASVKRTDQPQQSSYSQGAEVDARGQFIIDGLTSGEYEVTVRPLYVYGADPLDPRITQAFLSTKERVIVNSDTQRVTFVVDLSRKEGNR
jgi:Carboxypeptidase regulatory-like domain